MAGVLVINRPVGPGVTPLMAVGNYHLDSLVFQLEFINATAAGLTQLFIIFRSSVSLANFYSIVYSYNAAAAGVTNFNVPFVIPKMDLILPRANGIEINLVNGGNVTQTAVSVNMYGSILP